MLFPREIGFPYSRKTVYNAADIVKAINSYNGINNLHLTVYAFKELQKNRPVYQSAIIDKVYIDFDGPDSFIPLKRAHDYLLSKKLAHSINFSGRGYHLYIHSRIAALQNPKNAIWEFVDDFCKQADIKVSHEKEKSEIDTSIVGDLSRFTRMTNTMNLRSNLYCIPLSQAEIEQGDQHIRTLAKKQHRIQQRAFGTKLISLLPYDKPPSSTYADWIENTIPTEPLQPSSQEFEPCIENLLNMKDLAFDYRFLLGQGLFFHGYTSREIAEAFKSRMTPQRYSKAIIREKHHEEIVNTALNYKFSKSKAIRLGVCPGDCPFKNKVCQIGKEAEQ